MDSKTAILLWMFLGISVTGLFAIQEQIQSEAIEGMNAEEHAEYADLIAATDQELMHCETLDQPLDRIQAMLSVLQFALRHSIASAHVHSELISYITDHICTSVRTEFDTLLAEVRVRVMAHSEGHISEDDFLRIQRDLTGLFSVWHTLTTGTTRSVTHDDLHSSLNGLVLRNTSSNLPPNLEGNKITVNQETLDKLKQQLEYARQGAHQDTAELEQQKAITAAMASLFAVSTVAGLGFVGWILATGKNRVNLPNPDLQPFEECKNQMLENTAAGLVRMGVDGEPNDQIINYMSTAIDSHHSGEAAKRTAELESSVAELTALGEGNPLQRLCAVARTMKRFDEKTARGSAVFALQGTAKNGDADFITTVVSAMKLVQKAAQASADPNSFAILDTDIIALVGRDLAKGNKIRAALPAMGFAPESSQHGVFSYVYADDRTADMGLVGGYLAAHAGTQDASVHVTARRTQIAAQRVAAAAARKAAADALREKKAAAEQQSDLGEESDAPAVSALRRGRAAVRAATALTAGLARVRNTRGDQGEGVPAGGYPILAASVASEEFGHDVASDSGSDTASDGDTCETLRDIEQRANLRASIPRSVSNRKGDLLKRMLAALNEGVEAGQKIKRDDLKISHGKAYDLGQFIADIKAADPDGSRFNYTALAACFNALDSGQGGAVLKVWTS